MPDQVTGATGTQADPVTQPPAGTPPTQADGGIGEQPSPAPEALSLEEAKKLRSEAKSLRTRLKELEDEKKTADDEKLSETQRLTKRVAELEQSLADSERAIRERTVFAHTIEAASRLGYANPRLATRLLDPSAIEFEADGTPKNVEPLLRDLLKENPGLASAHVRPTGSIDGGTRGGTPNASTMAADALAKGDVKTSIGLKTAGLFETKH